MSFQLLAVLVAAAGMGMVGLTYGSASAYFMCGTLGALMVISYIAARLSGQALEVRRQVSDRVFEGEPFHVLLEVTNRGRVPLFLLKLSETVSSWLVSDTELGFVLPTLWPGETARLSYRLRGRKRGVHTIGPLQIVVSDPFGLFSRRIALASASGGEAVIYPRPISLRGSAARTGSEAHAISTGERARGAESGLDFYGVRDYQPGDELRRIHWPTTAHHAKLTVIEFDQGVSDNVAVLLDTRAGTEFGSGIRTTLEVAVQAAASLARWTLDAEGVFFLAHDSASGPQWLDVDRADREHEVLETLARVKADGTQSISSVGDWAVPVLPPGATVWVITAAPEPGLERVAEALRHAAAASSLMVLALDASSFDRSAPGLRVDELEARLAPAGGGVLALRRDHDLGEALESVLSTSI